MERASFVCDAIKRNIVAARIMIVTQDSSSIAKAAQLDCRH